MPPPSTSTSTARRLAELMLSSITQLESDGVIFPELNDYDAPPPELLDVKTMSAVSQIVSAAAQLVAIVRPAGQSINEMSLQGCSDLLHLSDVDLTHEQFHLSSCLRAAVEAKLFELVQEAGPEGIHVNELASKSKTEPTKTARILRLLANNHVFTELAPDVFCANRLSSVLVSGKPDTTIPSSTREPSGLAALVLMHTDESLKGAAYLSEAFTDPATAHSFEATHSPWNIAAKTNLHLFEYYQQPENARLKTRFSLAMEAATKLEPAEAILSGFEWKKLPKESVVVDVGGGVGATTFLLAKALPNLKFIVQDRPEVITDAQKYWDEKAPEFLQNNRVRLLAHDFFTPLALDFHDTTSTISAFLLRCIIHDWPDALALNILRNLRAAAHPSMHLVVVDVLLPYTCADTHLACEIPGASRPPAPEPLLPNGGAARNMQYFLDFQMYVLGNCQERTLGHFVSLAAQGGWKVVQVYHIQGSAFSQCVAVPL